MKLNGVMNIYLVNATFLNFRGRLISDGLLMPSREPVNGEIRRKIINSYKKALEKNTLIYYTNNKPIISEIKNCKIVNFFLIILKMVCMIGG